MLRELKEFSSPATQPVGRGDTRGQISLWMWSRPGHVPTEDAPGEQQFAHRGTNQRPLGLLYGRSRFRIGRMRTSKRSGMRNTLWFAFPHRLLRGYVGTQPRVKSFKASPWWTSDESATKRLVIKRNSGASNGSEIIGRGENRSKNGSRE
ncbi:hypothetical protein I7I48_00228 [Histoplasma ohiense]|nr:hypothetical protein I7I48_00228 [Histoplasma ohiense (nom. inval.)]